LPPIADQCGRADPQERVGHENASEHHVDLHLRVLGLTHRTPRRHLDAAVAALRGQEKKA
jgi:hypothetical protein